MKRYSDPELAAMSRRQLYTVVKNMQTQDFNLEVHGNLLPGAVMVQDISALTNIYMNKSGCDNLMHSLEELSELGPEYYMSFFPKEEIDIILPHVIGVHQRQNINEEYNFFQRVISKSTQQYKWYYTTSRLIKDEAEVNYSKMIFMSSEVSKMGALAQKFERILDEQEYVRANYDKYTSLTNREREIITLLTNGLNTSEIADQLFISKLTVNTHRRNISTKLNVHSFAKLIRFAMAFDLVR